MGYKIEEKILQRIKNVPKALREIKDGFEKKKIPYKYYSLAFFLAYTGARISEALSLTWDDIDLKNQTCLLPQLKKKRKIKREIPLHPKLCSILNMSTNKNGKVFDMTRQSAFLFFSKYKTSPHAFRHFFAIELLKRRVDFESIRRLLGHEGYDVLKEYLNLSLDDLREKINQLEIW